LLDYVERLHDLLKNSRHSRGSHSAALDQRRQ